MASAVSLTSGDALCFFLEGLLRECCVRGCESQWYVPAKMSYDAPTDVAFSQRYARSGKIISQIFQIIFTAIFLSDYSIPLDYSKLLSRFSKPVIF